MPESETIPGEWKCNCGLRRGALQNVSPEIAVAIPSDDPPTCPVDGSVMLPLTWRDAAEEAGAIAARWMKRAKQLEDAFPEGVAMPVEDD